MKLYSSRLSTSILAWLSLFLQVFVFMPFLIYATNKDEFSAGFLSIIANATLPALCLLSVFVLLSSILPPRIYRAGLALLLGLSLLFYVQSTFLVWDYGLFDGKDIAWEAYRTLGKVDLALWTATLIIALYTAAKIEHHGRDCALFLLFLSSTNIIAPLFDSFTDTHRLRWLTPPQDTSLTDLANFSKERNILHIILDGFLSPAFENIVKEDETYRNYFSDFTYYRNTLASFPTTAPSIPSILSGIDYDGSMTLPRFYESTLRKNSLPSVLTLSGFDTHLATLGHYCHFLSVTGCAPLARYNASDGKTLALKELAMLFDISLFRGLPQFLKVLVYNEQKWFSQQLFRKRKGPDIHVESLDLVDSFTAMAQASALKPTYKFVHLIIPHSPIRLNAACQSRSRKRRPTLLDYQAQARCALKLAHRVIEELKELNVYDQTMLIVSADHGFRTKFDHIEDQSKDLPSISYALPLLLIKPFHHRGPLQTSEVPARLADLPATVQDALNLNNPFPEKSIFSLNPSEQRSRLFRYYRWKHRNWTGETLPPMKEYIVNGHAWDERSWNYERSLPTSPP